jgi:hypothetical protein
MVVIMGRNSVFPKATGIFFWLIGSGLCYSTKGDLGGREKN